MSNAKEVTAAGSVNRLAGTKLQLLKIQSMDDTLGTVTPEDPFFFTVRLDIDGTVYIHHNCNRASGTYFSEPRDHGWSGGFEFGSLAATRVVCPLPNLDKRIVVKVEFVRDYLLREGRLYLSLMADGGIYAWAPYEARIPFENSRMSTWTRPFSRCRPTLLHSGDCRCGNPNHR